MDSQSLTQYFVEENIFASMALLLLTSGILIIIIFDLIRNKKEIKLFLSKCYKEFTLKDSNNNEKEKIKEYQSFRKYLAIYTFLSYLVIFWRYNTLGLPLWIEPIYLFFITLFIWRPFAPRDNPIVRAFFFILIIVIPLGIFVELFKADLNILSAGSLFAGLIIWIDNTFIASHSLLPEKLQWVQQERITPDNRMIYSEYLKGLIDAETKKLRYAITFYSVGCIGLLAKFIYQKQVDQVASRPEFKEMIVWAVIIGCIGSLGWGKGILYQTFQNRNKIHDFIKKLV